MIKKIFGGLTALALIAGVFAINTATATHPGYDISGTHTIIHTYSGTDYPHEVTLTQNPDGDLAGSGSSDSGNNTYTILGYVSGNTFEYTATYTTGATGTVMEVMGYVNQTDGTLSGTWTDNYNGGTRNGTIYTTTDSSVDIDPTNTVTIVKYVDGQMATTTSAQGNSFPMASSWTTNSGSGSGTYELSPQGYGNGPYTAVTSEMNDGASYSTNETTGGSVVGTSCTTGTQPYALQGYRTGNTLTEAQAATRTTTAPSFTNIQNDKYVIVDNMKCGGTTPPPSTPTDKDQCKNGGWATFTNPTFRNQGQCVSYVNGRR